VENDMNIVVEDEPISINTDGVCIHSGFSVAKPEPEVRLFSQWSVCGGRCVFSNKSFIL
jgi:hypothetical protein